jgi:hypothetical protein
MTEGDGIIKETASSEGIIATKALIVAEITL